MNKLFDNLPDLPAWLPELVAGALVCGFAAAWFLSSSL